jgi:hypothetical protein
LKLEYPDGAILAGMQKRGATLRVSENYPPRLARLRSLKSQ